MKNFNYDKESNKIKPLCKVCYEDEVYSETLTNGMCLNCYQELKEEYRLADIESECDYYAGYGIY